MATITPADPSKAPSLASVQVGEGHSSAAGFFGMKGAADAAAANPGHAFVDDRKRLLSSVLRLRRDAGIAGPGALWGRLVTIVGGALVAFSVALALIALPSFAESEVRDTATIAPTDPWKAPSLPILQVGEEHPLLLAFFRREGVADAAAANPGHAFVDARGRLLFVDMAGKQPVLSVSANPPTDAQLRGRIRNALVAAAQKADPELLGEAGFGSQGELEVYIQELLGLPTLAEVVTAVSDALASEPAPGDDPARPTRRLCKLMRTC